MACGSLWWGVLIERSLQSPNYPPSRVGNFDIYYTRLVEANIQAFECVSAKTETKGVTTETSIIL